MEDEDSETLDTSGEASVPSFDSCIPNDLPQQSSQIAVGPDRGFLVDGSGSLVRIRFPGCYTARRVYRLEDPQLNRMWMTTAITGRYLAHPLAKG